MAVSALSFTSQVEAACGANVILTNVLTRHSLSQRVMAAAAAAGNGLRTRDDCLLTALKKMNDTVALVSCATGDELYILQEARCRVRIKLVARLNFNSFKGNRRMKYSKLLLISAPFIFVAGLTACSEPGKNSDLSQKIEDKNDQMTTKMDNAADKLANKEEKTEEFLDDAAITAKVKSAILAETGLRVLKVHVETVNGVVTLVGSADSQKNIDKANEVATVVKGVKSVDNRLALNPSN